MTTTFAAAAERQQLITDLQAARDVLPDGALRIRCSQKCDSHLCGQLCERAESHPAGDYGHICVVCAGLLGGKP